VGTLIQASGDAKGDRFAFTKVVGRTRRSSVVPLLLTPHRRSSSVERCTRLRGGSRKPSSHVSRKTNQYHLGRRDVWKNRAYRRCRRPIRAIRIRARSTAALHTSRLRKQSPAAMLFLQRPRNFDHLPDVSSHRAVLGGCPD
jgi:hypothetical protein